MNIHSPILEPLHVIRTATTKLTGTNFWYLFMNMREIKTDFLSLKPYLFLRLSFHDFLRVSEEGPKFITLAYDDIKHLMYYDNKSYKYTLRKYLGRIYCALLPLHVLAPFGGHLQVVRKHKKYLRQSLHIQQTCWVGMYKVNIVVT
jgi:hypothetical protein